jgi:ABC-type dipeptide/oligopeptide/nickel transport system permease subunit
MAAIVLRSLVRRRVALAGAVLLAITVLIAVLAPVLAPWDPLALDVKGRLGPPAGNHWLGTDDVGRDVLSRVLYGAQISVVVGGLVVLLAVLAGLAVGLLTGSWRSRRSSWRSRSWRRSGRASGTSCWR